MNKTQIKRFVDDYLKKHPSDQNYPLVIFDENDGIRRLLCPWFVFRTNLDLTPEPTTEKEVSLRSRMIPMVLKWWSLPRRRTCPAAKFDGVRDRLNCVFAVPHGREIIVLGVQKEFICLFEPDAEWRFFPDMKQMYVYESGELTGIVMPVLLEKSVAEQFRVKPLVKRPARKTTLPEAAAQ
jgi:hypothetical protein